MKIELKSIKTYERLSEETTCFTANLYVDGKLLAHVENSGKGGCTDYHVVKLTDREKLVSVENYCKTLPDIVCDTFTFKSDLEYVMEKGLVYGNLNSYSIITWKNHTIASLLATPAGKNLLTKKVDELKSKGINVLNTNL